MSEELEDVMQEMVDATEVAFALRGDPIVKKLITAFRKAGFVDFDEDDLLDEFTAIQDLCAFDTNAFPLDGLGGLEDSREARLALIASLDRLIPVSRELRKSLSKTNRVLKVAKSYLRQVDAVQAMTATDAKDTIAVVLREITDVHDSLKMLHEQAKEAISALDAKFKTLDSWFNLHKQYVYLKGNRGPRGEQETADAAGEQQPRRRLGKRRND